MSRFSAAFRCVFVLARARTRVSSISPTSGHLMTDPMLWIAWIAASCTFSWVSLRTSRRPFTIWGRKLVTCFGAL